MFFNFIYDTNNFSLDGIEKNDLDNLRTLATDYDIYDLVYSIKQFETPTKMAKLPDEVLEEILGHLPLEDVLNMRRVSTRHARLAGGNKLWQWTFISQMSLYRGEKNFTSKVDFDSDDPLESITRTLLANLAEIAGNNLAWIISQVKVADLFRSDLTAEQSEDVFRFINLENSEHVSRLEQLYLEGKNLSQVDSHQMARAVVKIKCVLLYGTHLSPDQATAIFKAVVGEEDLVLEKLYMGWINLSAVDDQLLARAVVKIKTVNLSSTRLSAAQATAIFNAVMGEEDLVLEELYMRENNFVGVDVGLAGEVEKKVKVINS